jgi:hypothetical protein
MDETTPIRAAELVRRIRDEQAQQLAGKSDEEIIAFSGIPLVAGGTTR